MTAPERAQALRAALGEAYSVLQCRRALMTCGDDLARSAEWLTDGNWLKGVLVQFDNASLASKAQALSKETGRIPHDCLVILKHCAGNVDLARRKIAGKPAIDPARSQA